MNRPEPGARSGWKSGPAWARLCASMVVGSVLALVPWGFAAEPAQATHAQPVGRTPPVVFRTAATNEPASGGVLVPEEVRRGHDLARVYCAACHLFPDPELLDKKTWLNGALMKMAPMLGVARLNLASRPDGELLRGAGVFPEQPLISAEEWRAIVGYYQRMAPEVALPQTNSVVVSPSLPGFRVRSLEYEGAGPATTLVRVDPKQRRLFVGNAAAKSLDLLDAAGRLERRVMLDSAPSSIAWGRRGIYASLIGSVFPSDLRSGQVVELRETAGGVTVRTVLDQLHRPTHVGVGDLNRDGLEDLVVSAFGNHLGRFGWFEGREGGGFREHTLIERPGAIGSWVEDSDKDGIAEIWVLMAQAREGLVLFRRGPGGDFVEEPVAEFHPVFGVTSFQVRDFNSDGLPDVLITNGDNGEYPSPFKRYHGVRVLLNAGGGRFREGWFLAMNGAFKALAEDFDGDGDLDIAAISYFSDYATLSGGGFLMLENVGGLNFKASTMLEAGWGRWLTMDVGDLDEDGDVDVVLGSFVAGPMGVPVPPSVLEGWKRSRSAGLVLENRRR